MEHVIDNGLPYAGGVDPAPGRFAAFSFVDRITNVVPGVRLQGRYWIPDSIAEFPQSLAAEAVGQLAAWAAMAQFDYRVRPVAGLAEETRYHDECRPGQTLELAVELESCTEEAIAYSGTACVGERLVLELRHAVGPMMPMTDFDDPDRVRADYEVLRGAGRSPGRFAGVDAPRGVVVERVHGQSIDARLEVPGSAGFFTDHFPRRPVFPATLLMNALTHWALELARDRAVGTAAPRLAAVTNVKMRNWILPGQSVDLRADSLPSTGADLPVKLTARVDARTVATAKAAIHMDGRVS